MEPNYEVVEAGSGRHVKAWMKGVYFEPAAIQQLINAARLQVVHPYVAAMPDAHVGYGSTVGSVIPTRDAVVPSAVGVDIGCGMIYQQFTFRREDLPENLQELRSELTIAIPNGGPGHIGSWGEFVPQRIRTGWKKFDDEYSFLCKKHPGMQSAFGMHQLGTLGSGNHFVELVVDDNVGNVGVLIHSGSRGLGNKIGSYFTHVAKVYCDENKIGLPDRDLAFLPRETSAFSDYIEALRLAQRYAWDNRIFMMGSATKVLEKFLTKPIHEGVIKVHCHHNYMVEEEHFGERLFVTRKGAVRAMLGEYGIIPGSMGARTYIVRGLGSTASFHSCSHGAGRLMSRGAAKKLFTVEDHIKATEGIECDKTAETLDETPGCYKSIEAVMDAQSDLVERVYWLKQFLVVKGLSSRFSKRNNLK